MDPVSLATAAVALLAPYAPKLMEGTAGKIGEAVPETVANLYRWIRGRFTGHPVAEASLQQMETQAADKAGQEMLKLALAQRLEAEPELCDELFKLLPQEIQTKIVQTATASNGSATAQTAGNNNQITINLSNKP